MPYIWRGKKHRNTGFTMVEMLVVVSAMAVVSLSMYAVFNNGIKIWQRINKRVYAEDVGIFFDKFTSDVRNCFRFEGINFVGNQNSVECATFVRSPRLQIGSVGKVAYIYDTGTGSIKRQEADFSCVYSGEYYKEQELLRNIKSLKFSYYSYDDTNKQYIWQGEWYSAEKLPLAVKIEFESSEGGRKNFFKTINIPLAW